VDRLPFYQRPLRRTSFNAALILLAINVLLFFATQVAPRLQIYLSLIPIAVLGEGWWWQPFTYMFMHSGTWHLLFNMLALFIFGIQLEQRLGSSEFLLFYLLVGTLAGFFSLFIYWVTGSMQVILLGASGAVFGLLLAFATFFPTATILVFGILPVRAPILVIGYAALELFNMLTRSGGNVAHLTHLAGLLFAFLYLIIRMRINPITVFRESSRY
jgi:membrane associated rhomboid family serine protease